MISCYSGWGSMLTMHVQFFGVQTYAARLRVKILENSKSNFGFFMVHRDGAWDSQAFFIFEYLSICASTRVPDVPLCQIWRILVDPYLHNRCWHIWFLTIWRNSMFWAWFKNFKFSGVYFCTYVDESCRKCYEWPLDDLWLLGMCSEWKSRLFAHAFKFWKFSAGRFLKFVPLFFPVRYLTIGLDGR